MNTLTLLSKKQRKVRFEDFCIPGLPLNNLNLGELYMVAGEDDANETTLIMDISVNKTSTFVNSRDDLSYYVDRLDQITHITLRNRAVYDALFNACNDTNYGVPSKLKVIYRTDGASSTYRIKLNFLPDKEFKVKISKG